ncbi:lmo0937 family membrane protein [Amphibacillus cookii]|nr:lmo0937 family membrane protein [Amphibacillus cookii]MBM7540047.1 putative membrane metal-binding protein [Amphibacillus cookii]
MIWTIIGILILVWLLGLIFEIASGFIHILLVIALIVFIFNLITGRNRGV